MANFPDKPYGLSGGSDLWDSGLVGDILWSDFAAPAQPYGRIKVRMANGDWTLKPVKVWTGAAWVEKPIKRWTGAAWV